MPQETEFIGPDPMDPRHDNHRSRGKIEQQEFPRAAANRQASR